MRLIRYSQSRNHGRVPYKLDLVNSCAAGNAVNPMVSNYELPKGPPSTTGDNVIKRKRSMPQLLGLPNPVYGLKGT